jgi:Holliday junction resolvasome RuvABC endonuclease subunit
MIQLGVDYGVRRIAVANLTDGFALSFEIKKCADRGSELNYLADRYQELLIELSATYGIGNIHLWIEGAIMGHLNVQVAVAMGATQGAIMGTHGAPCTIVPPATWKAGTVGNGGAGKDDVADWLQIYHSDLYAICHSQDEIDAMCMALYGRMLTDGEIEPPKPKPKKKRKVKPDVGGR